MSFFPRPFSNHLADKGACCCTVKLLVKTYRAQILTVLKGSGHGSIVGAVFFRDKTRDVKWRSFISIDQMGGSKFDIFF